MFWGEFRKIAHLRMQILVKKASKFLVGLTCISIRFFLYNNRQAAGIEIHDDSKYFRLHNAPFRLFLFRYSYEISAKKYATDSFNAEQ